MSTMTAMISPVATADLLNGSHHRLTTARSVSAAQGRQGHRRPSADDTSGKKDDGVEDLFWDNEDDSFEVPDFHFDWGVAKEKTWTDMRSGIGDGLSNLGSTGKESTGARKSTARNTITPRTDTTPPSRAPPSTQSSSSSAHIMSLTDTSTASTTSLLPTPPNSSGSENSRSASSQGSASGGTGGARTGRIYASRNFQRVVSAPLTRQTNDIDTLDTRVDDIDLSASSSKHTLTATLRPPLSHTSSASSIHLDISSNSNTARNHFVTPGITDRIMTSTAASTGRRLGGLSRFGGPARRVVPPSEEPVSEEDNRNSPALTDSPRPGEGSSLMNEALGEREKTNSPEPLTRLRTQKQSPPQGAEPRRRPISENNGLEPEIGHTTYHRLAQASTSTSHRATVRNLSPLGARDRPFRPFQRHHELENEHGNEVQGATHRSVIKELARSTTSTLDNTLDRPPPQPLRPARSVPRVSASPPPAQRSPPLSSHALVADRPAPERSVPEFRSFTQAVPAVLPLPVPEFSQQSATLPAQPLQPGKRSFLVNGMPYERVGVLGKGGSSKVYSVLCPTKRIVYALKRVALDRADSETYQSYTNEIELLKRMRGHDRIIQLIDHQITFSQGNRPKMLMMVMECGEIDFATILDEQRGRPLNMNFVGLYWEQMLEAVHAVHLENVVHTDLKPANFVLVKGRLKIIDFGIAKAVANDTVNIQRDQQIGTVNYMSPEAIQRMNNQKVLKLSYPSDVWSLGCILYQMVYGNPPFAQIGGGPLPKMNTIADPSHRIIYPETFAPKPDGSEVRSRNLCSLVVTVNPTAIDSMKRCLAYRKEHRLTISELLQHEFLRPQAKTSCIPPGSTSITKDQMAMLVNFVLRENGIGTPPTTDTTAEDLFSQLEAQNALT